MEYYSKTNYSYDNKRMVAVNESGSFKINFFKIILDSPNCKLSFWPHTGDICLSQYYEQTAIFYTLSIT